MSSTQTLAEIQSKFSIPNAVRFESAAGGLIRALITTPLASATIYTHGAHVAEYQPTGQKPVLFMSAKSLYEPGKPIRGGVPVIFPWFGPRAGRPDSPMHGFVRFAPWSVESVVRNADQSVTMVLSLGDSEATRQQWPHTFALRYTVTVGRALDMALEVRNTSGEAFTFEEALHTYFAVADVRQASVTGLAGATYMDKTDGMKRKTQGPEPIRFTGETDRLYLNTRTTCVLEDPGLARRIIVEKSGSDSTVVWNPWIAKAKAMPDFGDEEWPAMACIETVNAADNAVKLAAGAKHAMTVRIRTEPGQR